LFWKILNGTILTINFEDWYEEKEEGLFWVPVQSIYRMLQVACEAGTSKGWERRRR
jgi:hypothetical protein